MKRIPSGRKRAEFYDLSDDWQLDEPSGEAGNITLMNLKSYKGGLLDKVETFIGLDGTFFMKVAEAEKLSEPGTDFDYNDYMRVLEYNVPDLIAACMRNLGAEDEDMDKFYATLTEDAELPDDWDSDKWDEVFGDDWEDDPDDDDWPDDWSNEYMDDDPPADDDEF